MRRNQRIQDEFENEIIDIRRVSKVTKGGRNLRFRVTMVVGDGKGRVGVGMGSTTEIPRAIQQAIRDAKKSLIQVNMDGSTIPHEIIGKFKAGNVLLKPAYPGTGVIAGTTVGAICRLAGIKDILTKSIGTTNPLTLSKAALKGLEQLRSRQEIEQVLGVGAQEVRDAA
ncbi:MAG: 30S ribosomal protein S5 [Candidatus Atribacteria bacterium]|jgi:small subunit ribosomal protein S5|nr:MAG: 30S ribosomal protein S5 [Candidatus Atribacteria bacterium]